MSEGVTSNASGSCESPEDLAERLRVVERERDGYRRLYELSREEVERLRRGLVGQSAERAPADVQQLSLAMLGLAALLSALIGLFVLAP